MEWSITFLAVVRFYSRIPIRRLPQNCICKFRKDENDLKTFTKKKAALKYLSFEKKIKHVFLIKTKFFILFFQEALK